MHPGFVNDKLVEAKPDRSSAASCALTGGKVCAHQIPAMVGLIQAFLPMITQWTSWLLPDLFFEQVSPSVPNKTVRLKGMTGFMDTTFNLHPAKLVLAVSRFVTRDGTSRPAECHRAATLASVYQLKTGCFLSEPRYLNISS